MMLLRPGVFHNQGMVMPAMFPGMSAAFYCGKILYCRKQLLTGMLGVWRNEE
jgi:hypothetical protein